MEVVFISFLYTHFMNDIPNVVVHQPDVKPTLLSTSQPSCYMILLDLKEDADQFHKRCLQAGFLIRSVGDKVLLLLSYDSDEYTKECLKLNGLPQFDVGLIGLGAYDVLHKKAEIGNFGVGNVTK